MTGHSSQPQPNRRSVLRAFSGAVVVAACSACSGLPESGPITEGRRLDEQQQQVIRVSPPAPFPGASKSQIVLGFIRAAEDLDEARPAAQLYLTSDGVEAWSWSTEDLYVFDSEDDLAVSERPGDIVRVSVPAVARVTPEGRYEDLPRTPISMDLRLTTVGGEWRIDLDQPYGLWLSATAFERLYLARTVHYVSARDALLVPDVRWFPRTETKLATTLARAQLDPVPAYLAGAATTKFPPGARLGVNAVPVEGRVATVELTEDALKPEPRDRAGMFAQMFATLGQVNQVDAVTMSASGVSLDLIGIGPTVSSLAQVGYSLPTFESFPTMLVRDPDEGTFARVDAQVLTDDIDGQPGPTTGVVPLLRTDPTLISSGWDRLALSFDATRIAAVGGDGLDLSRWGGEVLPFARFATHLGQPSFDTAGNIWVSGRDDAGIHQLYLVPGASADPQTKPSVIALPWLKDAWVIDLAFAPDGVRVLIVTEDRAGRSHLYLSSVARDQFGVPAGLAPGLAQAATLVDIRDVVWTETASFAVLGRESRDEAIRPWTSTVDMGLDGVRRSASAPARLAVVPSARAITTLGGARGLVLLTDDNRVLVRVGTQWREVRRADAVLVPGR